MVASFAGKAAGVYVTETDLSTVVTPVGTSVGAIVARANKGIPNCRVLITRDKELVDKFGPPHPDLGYGIYGGLELLKATDALYVVRATSGVENYAHVAVETSAAAVYGTLLANSSTTLLNTNGYEDGNKPNDNRDINTFTFGGTSLFVVANTGPGTDGNNLAVQIITSASAVSAGFDWQYKYDTNPLSASNPIWPRVFKINVFQKATESPNFTSVSGAPIETYYVSRELLLDANGNSLFIEDVINGISNNIYVKNNSSIATTTRPTTSSSILALTTGTNNATVNAGDIGSAWSLFNDKEKVSVNLLLCTSTGNVTSNAAAVQTIVGNIAASRQDSVCFYQVDGTSASVTNVTTIAANTNYSFINPSYAFPFAGWKLVFDSFTSRQIYLPLCIDGAVLRARTNSTANVWDAAAGTTRGRVSALGVFPVWNGTQIGYLMENNINTVKMIQGQGPVMWSQRTAQRKASALRDQNVRTMLNFIENSMQSSLIDFLFEPNTADTRLRIKSILDSFLGTVSAGGGFSNEVDSGYLVVCDSTNNTQQQIDNNILVVDCYVKPAKVINFIALNVIITRSGISFEELV